MTCRPLLVACACLLLDLLPPLRAAPIAAPPGLIPQPAQVTMADGGFEVEPNSRLSCQLIMTPDLDGLKVTLTNDSSN